MKKRKNCLHSCKIKQIKTDFSFLSAAESAYIQFCGNYLRIFRFYFLYFKQEKTGTQFPSFVQRMRIKATSMALHLPPVPVVPSFGFRPAVRPSFSLFSVLIMVIVRLIFFGIKISYIQTFANLMVIIITECKWKTLIGVTCSVYTDSFRKFRLFPGRKFIQHSRILYLLH